MRLYTLVYSLALSGDTPLYSLTLNSLVLYPFTLLSQDPTPPCPFCAGRRVLALGAHMPLYPLTLLSRCPALPPVCHVQGGGFSPLARARAEYKRLDRRLSQLNKDNSDLEREIERLTGGAKQDEDGGGGGTLDPFAPVQPGPAGTVRAPRTNPTLLPDRSVNPKLADILEDVHTNMEVLMAMGSSKVKELLDLWIQQVRMKQYCPVFGSRKSTEPLTPCAHGHGELYSEGAARRLDPNRI